MPEISNCPQCKRPVSVPERLIGKTVRCPSCKSTFIAKSIVVELEPAEEGPAARKAPGLRENDDDQPRRRRPIEDVEEETEDAQPERPRFRDATVDGWERVQTGLILVIAGFVVALISSLMLTLGSESDAATVMHRPPFQVDRVDESVREGAAALVCMFSGGAVDNAPARNSLWILSLVGIGVAAVLSAVGDGFCLQVPKDHRARSTAMSALVLAVMGYLVFLGGCIYSYMEFDAFHSGTTGKSAATSFGMIAGILGFVMLLFQPLIFMVFLRTAAVAARAEIFAGFLTFGLVVGGIGVVAYVACVIGLYTVVRDMLESAAGSRIEGRIDLLGTVGSISAIVAFFTFLTVSLWYIAALLLTCATIRGHIDQIR